MSRFVSKMAGHVSASKNDARFYMDKFVLRQSTSGQISYDPVEFGKKVNTLAGDLVDGYAPFWKHVFSYFSLCMLADHDRTSFK